MFSSARPTGEDALAMMSLVRHTGCSVLFPFGAAFAASVHSVLQAQTL